MRISRSLTELPPSRQSICARPGTAATRPATWTACHAGCHAQSDGLQAMTEWDGSPIHDFWNDSESIGAPGRLRASAFAPLRLRRDRSRYGLTSRVVSNHERERAQRVSHGAERGKGAPASEAP